MLKTRVITAVFLLVFLLAALFFLPPKAWSALSLIVLLTGGWEWARIAGSSPPVCRAYAVVTCAAGIALWWLLGQEGGGAAIGQRISIGLLLASLLFWSLVAPLWLGRGWKWRSPALLAVVGWIVLLPTWLALSALRAESPWLLLGTMALVWIADSAAYFSGRRFGRRKLAPSISPGKTWEGVAGAMLAVLAYVAIVVVAQDRNLWLLPASVLLTVFSIEGDLFESWMKRLAGLKDSSNLLPGHGGVLDRIDALTSTLPLATLILLYQHVSVPTVQ